jgi:hypothetical protein
LRVGKALFTLNSPTRSIVEFSTLDIVLVTIIESYVS